MKDYRRSSVAVASMCFSSGMFFAVALGWTWLGNLIVAAVSLAAAVTGGAAAIWSAMNPIASTDESGLILRLALIRPRQDFPWTSIQGWTHVGSGAGRLLIRSADGKTVKVFLSQLRPEERPMLLGEFQRYVGSATPG